ncbi:MAG TPA: metallophosphoesterase [Steroidobacteraceae bacterium]|jgi:predicted MPP superfamily phosphohydrolase|nr:metallophosphoesterase [Steroidobacteraceae bacterium]
MKIRRLTPVIILGLLHAYIGFRLLPDLTPAAGIRAVGAVALLMSCVLMLGGLMARSLQPRTVADRLAAAGLLAMSLFSSLFVLTLLRDLVLLPAALLVPVAYLPPLLRASALTVVGVAAFVTLVGFAGARRRARVVNVEVPLANLPPALRGFSIAQISDVHVGSTIKRPYVDAIVEAVNALNADLIAVTGDLVDGSVADLGRHIAPLGRLSARHGAFLVTGNHEYYSGEAPWTAEFRRLGLRVLLNEHVVIQHGGAPLVVAGVTDYSAHQFNPAQRSDPVAALSGAPTDAAARILLAHQPRSADAASRAGFDLQLSGHTHGGQFWPWNLFVRLQQPFTAGLHRLNHLWIYISRGTGYWGPPNRFGAPSEITLLRLVAAH